MSRLTFISAWIAILLGWACFWGVVIKFGIRLLLVLLFVGLLGFDGKASAQPYGGAAVYFNSGLTATVVFVKGSAGNNAPGVVHFISCGNTNAVTEYVQVFDTSATVSLGSTAPKMAIPIPVGGVNVILGWQGVGMINAIQVAATTTATGSTAPATAALPCSIGFN